MRHQVFKQSLSLITGTNHTRRQWRSLYQSSAQPLWGYPTAALGVSQTQWLEQVRDQHSLNSKGVKGSGPAAPSSQACSETATIYLQKALSAWSLDITGPSAPGLAEVRLSTLPLKQGELPISHLQENRHLPTTHLRTFSHSVILLKNQPSGNLCSAQQRNNNKKTQNNTKKKFALWSSLLVELQTPPNSLSS